MRPKKIGVHWEERSVSHRLFSSKGRVAAVIYHGPNCGMWAALDGNDVFLLAPDGMSLDDFKALVETTVAMRGE